MTRPTYYPDQAHTLNLMAILEYPTDNSKHLKVIPYIDQYCSFDHSLLVAKDHILWIENTKETYYCGGKMHNIVKLYFKANATVPISDVIPQVMDTIKAEHDLIRWKRHIKMSGEMLSPF